MPCLRNIVYTGAQPQRVLLGPLGGGVLSGSTNPDPISSRAKLLSLAVKCKSEENCAFDDKSTIFGTEIIEILRNIF